MGYLLMIEACKKYSKTNEFYSEIGSGNRAPLGARP
jgi:hypothetical protein